MPHGPVPALNPEIKPRKLNLEKKYQHHKSLSKKASTGCNPTAIAQVTGTWLAIFGADLATARWAAIISNAHTFHPWNVDGVKKFINGVCNTRGVVAGSSDSNGCREELPHAQSDRGSGSNWHNCARKQCWCYWLNSSAKFCNIFRRSDICQPVMDVIKEISQLFMHCFELKYTVTPVDSIIVLAVTCYGESSPRT